LCSISARAMEQQLWRVIGGGDKGGIVVRIGCGLQSALLDGRLSTGAIVRQLSLFQGRLNYELVKGDGPEEGWVSLKFKDTDLLVKSDGSDADPEPPRKLEVKKEGAGGGAVASAKLPTRPPKRTRDNKVALEDYVAKLGASEKILESADEERIREALDELTMCCVTASPDLAGRYACMWARKLTEMAAAIRLEKTSVLPKAFVQFHNSLQQTLSVDGMGMDVVQPSEPFTGQAFFIFGYGGSRLEDLKDAGQFYSKNYPGALVVTCIAAKDAISMGMIAEVLELVVNAWADKPDVTPSLVIHLFSNMGAMAWNALLRMWVDQEALPDESRLRGKVPAMQKVLRALIFDSSPYELLPFEPGVQSITNGAAATYSMLVGFNPDGSEMDKTSAMRASMEAKMEWMHPNCALRTYYDSNKDEMYSITRPSLENQRELEPLVPMLFIYSTVDKIIPWEGVEMYIGECESRLSKGGKPAPRRLKFEDRQSAHCFHKKVHTEEYWNAVSSLLKDVL